MAQTRLGPIPSILFYSRWLQLPLYLGLIVAQGVYVWYFMVELTHLVEAAFGSKDALELILRNVTPPGAETVKAPPETLVMLVVLGLIDVVMISNLLIMVIVGGYETFVSRMRLEGHPDQPEWLSHVNASVLKVKLAFHGPLTAEQRTQIYNAVAKCPVHKLMTTTDVVIETAPLE